MKKTYLILFLVGLFTACSMVKAPEFKGITGIDFKKNDEGKLVLVAYAKYHNPNLLGGKFKVKDVKVYVNDKYFANLNSETYKVPTKRDFELPLEVDFDASYFKKGNILDAVNNLLNNKLKVKYEGKIYYVSHKLNIPYEVDYEQEVKIIE